MERKWGNDNGGSAAWKTAAIHDKDGSVSGVPNSYILIHDGVNDSIATDAQACEIKPTWNAAVCKGDVGRLSVGAPGGGFGAGPRAVPAAGRSGAGALPVLARAPAAQAAAVPRCTGWWLAVDRAPRLSRQSFSAAMAGSSPSTRSTNVRAGTEIKVTTERPSVNLSLTELDSRLVGDLRAAGIHHRSLGYGSRAAWMRCARPAPPRTTRARMHCGSRWSPTAAVLAAPSPAVEPACRSAGNQCVIAYTATFEPIRSARFASSAGYRGSSAHCQPSPTSLLWAISTINRP